MSTQRFVIENNGPTLSTVQKLFEQSAAFCLRNRISQLSLVMNPSDELPDTVIAEYLGPTVAHALCRGTAVTLVKGLDLRLLQPAQLQHSNDNGLVVAALLSLDALANLDANPALKALAFVPWPDVDGERWIGIWSPRMPGDSLQAPHCA